MQTIPTHPPKHPPAQQPVAIKCINPHAHRLGHTHMHTHTRPLSSLFLPGVCQTVHPFYSQRSETGLVLELVNSSTPTAFIPSWSSGCRQQMAPGALKRLGEGLRPELLASPLPPLEWDNLGVICGRPAKALNLLLGAGIISPRRGTERERGGRKRGGGCSPGQGHDSSSSGSQRRPHCKAPSEGVSETRAGHTLEGEMLSLV